MRRLLLGLVALATCGGPPLTAHAQAPPEGQQNASPPIRYLDMTARTDGWGAAQLAATAASKDRNVVVVSYLDPQQTRALYDEAVRFMADWKRPRITGVIRSPSPPAHMNDGANPLGFDLYFDGAFFPRDTAPDPRFSVKDHLGATLRAIQRNNFTDAGSGCFDIEREPDPATGGLRIPRQRVCPTGKLPSP